MRLQRAGRFVRVNVRFVLQMGHMRRSVHTDEHRWGNLPVRITAQTVRYVKHVIVIIKSSFFFCEDSITEVYVYMHALHIEDLFCELNER